MADLENLNSKEDLARIPDNMEFPETNETIEKDPELVKTREIIEKWWNTSQITKLTPELTDMMLKSDKLYLDLAALDLHNLTEIDKWVAEKLVWYKGTRIDLSWLTEIDEWVAENLSKITQCDHIILDWLSNISEWVAKKLSWFLWTIELNWLWEISVDVARALSNHIWTLTLSGLTDIDAQVVRELANHTKMTQINMWWGKVWLGSLINLDWQKLQNMDEETIREFAKHYSRPIFFNDWTGTINRLKREFIMKDPINKIQRTINTTKEKENWQADRWDIEYNDKNWTITSRWYETKTWGIRTNFMELYWLALGLSHEEWVWLANLKNWIKYKKDTEWGDKQVEYKEVLFHKKTLCMGNTILISRRNLGKFFPKCVDDKIMEQIVEWLNK